MIIASTESGKETGNKTRFWSDFQQLLVILLFSFEFGICSHISSVLVRFLSRQVALGIECLELPLIEHREGPDAALLPILLKGG